jgi:uncharacterized iron-regulated protein
LSKTVSILILLCTGTAGAADVFAQATLPPAQETIVDTATGRRMTLAEFAGEQRPGDLLVLGEEHATPDNQNDPGVIQHHRNQVRLLAALTAEHRFRVDTAMEFLTYTDQAAVDRYLSGQTSDDDFKKAAHWGSAPFALYREQILIPRESGGRTVALNIPMAIAARVAQAGPGGLSPEQRELLPPLWERGGPEYFARFREAMGDHAPPQAMERYFWAQSLWDDTMAWNAVKNQAADPGALTLVIVGGFHVEFGHGLPARLARHGGGAIKTLLQVEAPNGLSPEEIARLTRPDPRYGPRADYLWLHRLDAAAPALADSSF